MRAGAKRRNCFGCSWWARLCGDEDDLKTFLPAKQPLWEPPLGTVGPAGGLMGARFYRSQRTDHYYRQCRHSPMEPPTTMDTRASSLVRWVSQRSEVTVRQNHPTATSPVPPHSLLFFHLVLADPSCLGGRTASLSSFWVAVFFVLIKPSCSGMYAGTGLLLFHLIYNIFIGKG